MVVAMVIGAHCSTVGNPETGGGATLGAAPKRSCCLHPSTGFILVGVTNHHKIKLQMVLCIYRCRAAPAAAA